MHIYNSDITPVSSQHYIWQPIANKLYSPHCWFYSTLYKKTRSQLMIFIYFPVEEIIIPCTFCAPLVPPDLLRTHYI